MATTEAATEREAIASVVEMYIDGTSKGDTARLIDGAWKIVNKAFAHTGGETPAA
jgi:hypothetical protein